MAAQDFPMKVCSVSAMRNVGYHTTGNRLAGKLCGSLGIRGFKNGRKSGCGFIRMKEESILELNEIRERFVRKQKSFARIFRKKKTVKEYCGFLYEFIVSRIQEKLYEQEEVFAGRVIGQWKRNMLRFTGSSWSFLIK